MESNRKEISNRFNIGHATDGKKNHLSTIVVRIGKLRTFLFVCFYPLVFLVNIRQNMAQAYHRNQNKPSFVEPFF